MAKFSSEEKQAYFNKVKPYKEAIDAILLREKNLITVISKDSNGAGYKRLMLAEEMLNLASNYIVMSGVSVGMLGLRNEDALNEARKALYKSIIYLEETTCKQVDAPFSDYEDKLAEIATFDAAKRYNLIRKLGLAIRLVEDAYGDNTKWKWTFVELEARFAAVAKNIFDLKAAQTNTDPRSSVYEPTVYHLRLIKKLLTQAADRYREKYELSTNRFDDFKLAIAYLNSLRRIHLMMGERDDAESVKKKTDIWATKLETDQKKREEAKKV